MNSNQELEEFVNDYTDWRGQRLKELVAIIQEAGPELKVEFKWGVPVWSQNGLVCAISGFKDHVKMNFFKGAKLADQGPFNSGLDSKDHRSINWAESDILDKSAIQRLINSAIELNQK